MYNRNMKYIFFPIAFLALLAAYLSFDFSMLIEREQKKNTAFLEEQMAEHIGTLAYLYGYPLVDMYEQRHNETHLVADEQIVYAPINRFYRFSQLVTPTIGGNLRAPNADTLYYSGWYDINEEPLIIHTPDTHGRYFTIAVTNSYSEVVHIGRRTTGTQEGHFALVKPDWDGELPKGVKPIITESPTGWLLGRMMVDGPHDFDIAKALVDDIWLAKLSEFTPKNRPPTPNKQSAKKIDLLKRLEFFQVMNEVLQTLPQRADEAALLAQFKTIGIGANKIFDIEQLSDATRAGLNQAIENGTNIIDASTGSPMPTKDGWIILEYAGRYGHMYRQRAMVVKGGYANLPEESIYPARILDNEGNALTGSNRYRIKFSADNLPDVNAFWSLSAYNLDKNRTLEPNEIERYSLGDRTQGIRYEDDGSLEIVLQHKRPEDISNWLPVPDGLFVLVLRMYEPSEAMLSGNRKLPQLERAL